MKQSFQTTKEIINIGFVSTRIAGTDGVSLEIKKWTDVLERNRFSCFFFAGELDRPEDKSFLVEEAHFEHPEIKEIDEHCFRKIVRPSKTSRQIHAIKERLKKSLRKFVKNFDIDLIIAENALTIPMNVPLGLAITEFIAETATPAIAHHHDFFWERERFLVTSINDLLQAAFPPGLPSIQHVVINSIASNMLSYRVGLSNIVIPNVYDYSKPPEEPDPETIRRLREEIGLRKGDPLILQPTRLVPRKWIERSIEMVAQINLRRPMLVVSHASGDEGGDYAARIKQYARLHNVEIAYINHLIGPDGIDNEDGNTKYTIADIYEAADFVTYPSGYEGFGNAFLEAIYHKKPIVVNRYSVFIADIEPKGFRLSLIDGFVSSETIKQIMIVLNDEQLRKDMAETNYCLAGIHFSYEMLEKLLCGVIERF